ncbi:hypothetical protein CYMTET_4937 [Cymbomonas tetramitiformis]|uniref:Uncharacterized protein n=1 Tax=Cymbomonas tetramitiformis TaxID=36881 RepID=A0AAE0H065_9CHLO|nr:hypothetical protein CYMTET_4937 [Cymbomonas tetramitiformis]
MRYSTVRIDAVATFYIIVTSQFVGTEGTSMTNLGGSGCTSSAPCSACSGDCDYDTDCAGSLVCFQRAGTEAVPGCTSGGSGDYSSYDYCYDSTYALVNLGGTGCTSSSQCSSCKGDCDSDADCVSGTNSDSACPCGALSCSCLTCTTLKMAELPPDCLQITLDYCAGTGIPETACDEYNVAKVQVSSVSASSGGTLTGGSLPSGVPQPAP